MSKPSMILVAGKAYKLAIFRIEKENSNFGIINGNITSDIKQTFELSDDPEDNQFYTVYIPVELKNKL